ncbi:MAG: DUF2177 family protein [Myxococcota bacterium]
MTEEALTDPRSARTILAGALSVALSLLVLDLIFLGVLAKPFFDEALGPLRRTPVFWPAALLFYAMYVGVVTTYAVLPARSIREALRRGASLGFVAYATYELTNWAVLANWPARLVPVDILWGVVLTSLVAVFGYAMVTRLRRRGER